MSQVKLENWRAHVLTALQTKQSFAQYARAKGVSRHTLYVAHKLMKANGEVMPAVASLSVLVRESVKTRVRSAAPAFVPVTITPLVATVLRVPLPNGLALHFDAVDAPLLQLLASLPCLN